MVIAPVPELVILPIKPPTLQTPLTLLSLIWTFATVYGSFDFKTLETNTPA